MGAHLTLIAAVSADGFISRGKGVPWELPVDRAHFRAATRDKWLLLGRRTFEEMRGWFQPGHHALVLTRDDKLSVPGGQTVNSVTEAVRLASDAGESELVCCGGAEIYAAAMPHAQRLVITHVHEILGGGLPFPVISPREWEPVIRHAHVMDAQHTFDFEIVTYQRVMRRDFDLAA
jgi:dihydrofolate reductase